MIRSRRNTASRKIRASRNVWAGERPNRFRGMDFEATIDLLLALDVAATLQDLGAFSSVGLHKLKGDRRSQ